MRWHIKRTKLLLALIPIISIAFYMLTANNNIYADQSFTEFDIYQQISTTAKPSAGSSPADYSAAENFAIAADVYLNTDCVQSTTNGTVTAMGFYKQTVMNYRAKYGDEIFSESVSLSALASVAEQRYFKNGALLYRKGEASGGAVKSWSESITELSNSVYRRRYGVVPREITKYSVTPESIESGSFVSENADGTYTFELIMIAPEAHRFARYEMMTFAGVTSFPEFLTCRIVYTIDDAWVIREVKSYDTYKIDIMGGTKCESSLTETYTYDDEGMPERAQPFVDYVPTGSTSDVSEEKGPSDYLDEAFGAYITGGETLKLTATAEILGTSYPVNAVIDIQNADYRFTLGDKLFAVYKDDTVYLKAGENSYKLAISDLGALGVDTSGFELGDDVLETLFANYSMEESDTHMHILMPFTLMGIDFDVDMGLKKTEDGSVTADTINATVLAGPLKIKAAVQITDSVELPVFDESSYVPLKPAIDAAVNTVNLPAYLVRGSAEVTTGGKTVKIDDMSLRIIKTETEENGEKTTGAEAEGHVTLYGITAGVKYKNGNVYVEAGNIKAKAAIEDFNAITETLSGILPEISLPSFSDPGQLITKNILKILPGGLNLDTVITLLSSVDYADGNLNLAVKPAKGKAWSLGMTHGDIVSGVTLSGFEFEGIGLNADLTLNKADATPVTVDENEYIAATDLVAFVPEISKLISAQSYSAQIDAEIVLANGKDEKAEPVTLGISGNLYINRDPLAVKATLTVTTDLYPEEMPVGIVYVNNTVYITAGDFAASVTVDDVYAVAEKFGYVLPRSLEEITGALRQEQGTPDINAILGMITLGYNGGVLSASATLDGGVKVTLDAATSDTALDAAISVNVSNADIKVSAQVQSFGSAAAIKPEEANYINLYDFVGFIDPIKNTLGYNSFGIKLEGALVSGDLREPFTANLNVALSEDGVTVLGSAVISRQVIDIAVQNGTVYIRAGEIAVKAKVAEMGDLLSTVIPLINDAGVFVTNLSPYIGENKAEQTVSMLGSVENILGELVPVLNAKTASEAIKLFAKTSLAESVMPELSYRGITSLLAGVSIQDGAISVPVTTVDGNTYNVTVRTDNSTVSGLDMSGLNMMGLAVNINASVVCGTQPGNKLSDKETSEYTDINIIKEFVPALSGLLRAKAYSLNITSGLVNSSVVSGEISGRVELSLNPLQVQAQLKFRSHDIYVWYDSSTVFLKINDIKLTFAFEDIDELVAEINKYVQKAGGSVEDAAAISEMAVFSTQPIGLIESAIGKPLSEILSYVGYLEERDGEIIAGLSAGKLTLSAGLAATSDTLKINVNNFSYGGYVYDSSIRAELSPIASVVPALTETDKASYVGLNMLKGYIAPAMQTIDQKQWHLSFGGSVLGSDNGATSIAGELKIMRTEGFINAYANIILGGKTGDQNIEIYLIDGTDYTQTTTDENGEIVKTGFNSEKLSAYVNYNGFKAQIDYVSVLGIIGSACDILNLDIPMVENLIHDHYTHIQTDVFKTMDIAGLDSLRKTIMDLLNTAEDVTDAADVENASVAGITALISDEILDNVLGGVSIGFDENGFLYVTIDNGIFALANKGKKATVTIGHDNEYLTYVSIANLIANGDTVNFNANIDCDEFPPILPPDGAMDFSSIDSLLYSLIKTADLRNFHITGSIKLSVPVISNPVIPFDVNVKILDDGSTVAAVKLEVPFVSAALAVGLTRTNSYIYFANNRLYFIVDIWNSWAWSEGSYKSTEMKSATVEEFLANPMDYLFFLLRMNDIIKSPIQNAITKGGSGTPSNRIQDILKSYTYENNNYSLKIGLAELVGSSDLSDLNITINTQNDIITGLSLDTKFVNVVGLSLQNTKLANLTYDQSGNVNGASPLGVIDFGQSSTVKGLALSKNIDTIEDDLALIFPVDAAETFAEKALSKAAKANAAENEIAENENDIAKYTDALLKAESELAAARKKLAATPEGSFGYDRIQAQVTVAEKTLANANEKLAHATALRITNAVTATGAAEQAFKYARKAAAAAEKALMYQSSVRSYAAAGDAAMAAVDAIDASTKALNAAIKAAKAAGENGTAVLDAAQTQLDELKELLTVTAIRASTAASTACRNSIDVTENTAKAATEAAESGNWFEAAEKAAETLNAIEAMTKTAKAATAAAKLSGDESVETTAADNAEKVRSMSATAATAATKAATAAANNIATNGKNIADDALTQAESGNAAGAVEQTASALTYADAATAAANGANTAVRILAGLYSDEESQENTEITELAQNAEQAAEFSKNAATYIGDVVLDATNKTLALYAESLKTTDIAVTAADGVASSLEAVIAVIDYAGQAKQYAPGEENVALLTVAYRNAKSAADNALGSALAALTELAKANAVSVAEKKAVIDNTSTKTDARSAVEKAATGLIAPAEETTHLADVTASILASIETIYSKTQTALTDNEIAGLKVSVLELMGSDGSGYNGIYEYLRSSSAVANEGAKHITALANNLSAGFLNIYKNDVEKAQTAAANATTAANDAISAAEQLFKAINSLLSAF